MSKVISNSNTGFKHENSSKVAFVIGRLYDKMPSEFDDWDEIQLLIERIVDGWENLRDIRNFEEEGYIQAYAERIILELINK